MVKLRFNAQCIMSKLNFLVINGSISSTSVNGQIISWLESHYRDNARFEIYRAIAELPHFRPDNKDNTVPEPIMELYRLIENAHAVLICTPEYIYSLPAVLKNLLEWTVSTTLFAGKSTAFIVASTSGQMAFNQLELILDVLSAKVGPDGKLFIPGAKAKFDGIGRLTDNSLTACFDRLMASLEAPDI